MKRPFYPLFLLCWMVIFFLSACGGEGGNDAAEADAAAEIMDSTETDLSPAIETSAPELIGKWKLVSQRAGDFFISPSEIDEPMREFTADGKMILTTNAHTPQTIQYSYLNGIISTLQEGDQYVKHLSADSLVLTETVDGVEAEYIFVKIR